MEGSVRGGNDREIINLCIGIRNPNWIFCTPDLYIFYLLRNLSWLYCMLLFSSTLFMKQSMRKCLEVK